MALVHCRVINGVEKFRIWSKICDEYMSDEMTEEEAVQWLREEAMRVARQEFERELPQRMERAKNKGSSSRIDSENYLEKPWAIMHHD